MTNEQILALEALYKATNGKSGTFVDLHRANLLVNVSTLLYLVKNGFIRMLGRGLFTLTLQGIDQAHENQHIPSADA